MARETRQATIALVGIDGAGKTTQARWLKRWLTQLGHPVRYRMVASGRRVLGNTARRLGRPDSVALLGPGMAIRAETLLRYWNLTVGNGGGILIADRYAVCQYARTRVVYPRLEPWARRLLGRVPPPDLTLYLDVAPETAHLRVKTRGIDEEPVDSLAAMDSAYRSLPEFASFAIVDANRDPEEIAETIRDEVRTALPRLLDGRT
ncbi:dTMP kinase [Stackebrandtia nassauensis]|uniref:Thymidylate kinase n=1 Tax=Stackebrandtia nassauensis (strain DSM 44728 / CIP 108903 / NRRL B-16338 / NBRC 102104 / LLR-40K-21) TaxID=446470 RepID=D3Q3J8_STANL|nr:dTMP kinase [Stackebrandtia nassauensis]ADD42039.1 thymidylate kinase [Stackebrandtia nassauensis DSM 44728]